MNRTNVSQRTQFKPDFSVNCIWSFAVKVFHVWNSHFSELHISHLATVADPESKADALFENVKRICTDLTVNCFYSSKYVTKSHIQYTEPAGQINKIQHSGPMSSAWHCCSNFLDYFMSFFFCFQIIVEWKWIHMIEWNRFFFLRHYKQCVHRFRFIRLYVCYVYVCAHDWLAGTAALK